MTVVLIPAHNEQDRLPAALASLAEQTCRPDRIIVVSDNSTDDTVAVAQRLGAEVMCSVDNTDKKSGALNQAMARVLPTLADHDQVLVQDADSTLSPEFIEEALLALEDPQVGAVGGIFHGEPGGGLLGLLQRMEYTRYARDLDRTGRVWVLTGTATMLRVSVMRQLVAARGTVYESGALTEDMELTLAVRSLGHRLVSPASCVVTTEVMPSVPALFRQRLRWQRGALENLRTYGYRDPVTWPYLRQQAVMALGTLAITLYITYMILVAVTGQMGISGWWLSIGLIFIAERVVTVWPMGGRVRALAAVLVFDFGYDLILQTVLVRALFDSLTDRPQLWHHDTSTTTTTVGA